jgi:thiamine pyrophosphokinase
MERAVRHAVVLADGTAPTRARLDAAWPRWDDGVELVVAADGGARHAGPLGLRIDRWVGDGDSIDPGDLAALAASGVAIERASTDKDESDTELAVLAAIATEAGAITLLGALGGVRIDHALANVALLQDPALDDRWVRLYDEQASRISILSGDASGGPGGARVFEGRIGDIVTLLPLGRPAEGVATQGLRYALAGQTLALGRSRGLSNVRTEPAARISLASGRLLVIETPATLRP